MKGPNRLYKNLGNGKFRDVTDASGLGFAGFCHGIIVGDIDNDGDQDVFLCNYGPNVLYLNNGDGTFKDISKSAGIDRDGWSSGGGVPRLRQRRRPRPLRRQLRDLEVPRGRLSSAATRTEEHPVLLLAASIRSRRPSTSSTATTATAPSPTSTTSFLDRRRRGQDARPGADGHGFGVVTADFERRRPDRHLRHQRHEPQLPLPQQGRRHLRGRDRVLRRGLRRQGPGPVGHGGRRRGRRRRRPARPVRDQLRQRVQHPPPEPGQGRCSSTSTADVRAGRRHHALRRLGASALPTSTTTAGPTTSSPTATSTTTAAARAAYRVRGAPLAPPQPPDRAARARFRLATRDAGPYFDTKHVGRGAAFGDIDNDGDIDIVVNHKDGAPALLRNDTKTTTAGSASSSSGPRATATPSGPGQARSRTAGPSTASAKADAASTPPTTPAC